MNVHQTVPRSDCTSLPNVVSIHLPIAESTVHPNVVRVK